MDTTEKQGYIGDLSKKTGEELQELFHRQQKLLANVKFVKSLPDKGEKIKNMIKKINEELQSRMDVDSTADLLHKMVLNMENTKPQGSDLVTLNVADPTDVEEEEDADPLREIVNVSKNEKQILDNRSTDDQFVNSYERVIKRAEEKNSPKKKFYPNKTIKTEHVDHLSEELKKTNLSKSEKDVVSLDEPPPLELPPPSSTAKVAASASDTAPSDSHSESITMKLGRKSSPGKLIDLKKLNETSSESATKQQITGADSSIHGEHTIQGKDSDMHKQCEADTKLGDQGPGNLKYLYDESLENSTYGPPKKYESAKLISVEESVHLMQLHKQKQEELQAQQASDRLAQRLGIKMVQFEPKNLEMRYRHQAEEDSGVDDSDSEGKEDYPD